MSFVHAYKFQVPGQLFMKCLKMQIVRSSLVSCRVSPNNTSQQEGRYGGQRTWPPSSSHYLLPPFFLNQPNIVPLAAFFQYRMSLMTYENSNLRSERSELSSVVYDTIGFSLV